jgi:hypothetical protein
MNGKTNDGVNGRNKMSESTLLLDSNMTYQFVSRSDYFLEYIILNGHGDRIGNISGTDIPRALFDICFSASVLNVNFNIKKSLHDEFVYTLRCGNEVIGAITMINNMSITYNVLGTFGRVECNAPTCYDQESFWINDHIFGQHRLLLATPRPTIYQILINILKLFTLKLPDQSKDYLIPHSVGSEFSAIYFLVSAFLRCSVFRFDYNT